jgi:NitT/TauT family transport system substrate-binding protein
MKSSDPPTTGPSFDEKIQLASRWQRRDFLKGIAAVAGSAGLLGYDLRPTSAEPPPETTRIRLVRVGLCVAPQYVAEDLLRAEGFTDIQYLPDTAKVGTSEHLATGAADVNMAFAAPLLIRVDAGEPVVLLGGVHVGCYELFATERVHTITDLRGKKVAVPGLGSSHHLYLSFIVAYVGLDPRKDIDWVSAPPAEAKRLLADGGVDAYLGFAPDPQELRANGVGHVLVNSSLDRPWSQYFCCIVAGNREFVAKHPVATKRALRAILKAADICATEPGRVARFLVARGYAPSYEYALQTMREVPYQKWREYNPEDTVRFYGLRLQEVGMIKSDPKKLIAQGTDWRFLNELKKELKA